MMAMAVRVLSVFLLVAILQVQHSACLTTGTASTSGPFLAKQQTTTRIFPRHRRSVCVSSSQHPHDDEQLTWEHQSSSSRRSLIRNSAQALAVLSTTIIGTTTTTPPAARAAVTESAPRSLPSSAAIPKVTDRVMIDVRISRPDGTFYIRGDETDELVKKYSIQIGLFGDAAPTHVERFLSYVRPSEEVIRDDVPFPSYGQSLFKSFDQGTGVLFGGSIPSLEEVEFAGSTALKYGGRIMPAPLWLEKNKDATTASKPEALPLPHSTKGLLIHRKLDVTPNFGMTTRSDPGSYVSDFDREFVAFGCVLEGMEFLNYVSELPTYSVERPPGEDDNLVQDAAKAVFDAQRELFRGAAKSIGDTRVSKVYPGKLLRRVEVTRVAVL